MNERENETAVAVAGRQSRTQTNANGRQAESTRQNADPERQRGRQKLQADPERQRTAPRNPTVAAERQVVNESAERYPGRTVTQNGGRNCTRRWQVFAPTRTAAIRRNETNAGGNGSRTAGSRKEVERTAERNTQKRYPAALQNGGGGAGGKRGRQAVTQAAGKR